MILRHSIIELTVCLDIKMFLGNFFSLPESYHWTVGSCSSSQGYRKRDQSYMERCCLPPGDYVLTCSHLFPGGERDYSSVSWSGWVDIQGNKYCHQFLGYRSMDKISVLGKDIRLTIINIIFHFILYHLIFIL